MGNGGGLGIVLWAKQLSAHENTQKLLSVWVFNWPPPSHSFPAQCFHPLRLPGSYRGSPYKPCIEPERSLSKMRTANCSKPKDPNPVAARPPSSQGLQLRGCLSEVMSSWQLKAVRHAYKFQAPCWRWDGKLILKSERNEWNMKAEPWVRNHY